MRAGVLLWDVGFEPSLFLDVWFEESDLPGVFMDWVGFCDVNMTE